MSVIFSPIFIPVLLAAVVVAVASGLYLSRVRRLDSATWSYTSLPDASRYKPMLRLLSHVDLEFVPQDQRSKMRAQRRAIFRRYLACLTRDYGRMLAGVRAVMVESGTDRPELAQLLAKSRVNFALALCRIEFRLQMHALGMGDVDVTSLVEAFDSLRSVMNAMTPVAMPTAA